MRPKSIYQVVFFTQFVGSILYAPLLWDPFFSDRKIEWDEVGPCVLLTLTISFICLLPFFGLLKLFEAQPRLNKLIPYDGWQLQFVAFVFYSCFILYTQREFTDLMNWYIAYYPIGIFFFIRFRTGKLQ